MGFRHSPSNLIYGGFLALALIAGTPASANTLGGRNLADCNLPPVTAGTKIVLLGAYEARARSGVSLGLQDNEIRAGVISVSDSVEPLAVIITTYRPAIWSFQGATNRISWVVLNSQNTAPNSSSPAHGLPLGGVVGLPASRVRFLPRSDCLPPFYQHYGQSEGVKEAKDFVARQFGRNADVVASAHDTSGFAIPAGTVYKFGAFINEPSTADMPEFLQPFASRQVVNFDGAAIVASQPVTKRAPDIKQLMADGAIIPKGNGDFRIVKKIRFPPELYGANARTFYLAPGIGVPEGNPGHSCVISEKTGKPLFGCD